MEGFGDPAQPSPTIGQCLNGGYGWLEVKCRRCESRASLFVAGKEGEVLSNFWDKRTGWHEWFPELPEFCDEARQQCARAESGARL